MSDPRPETGCDCRTFLDDGTGWYCATHGNPAETMADVMDDTARHTDELLRRAEDWHLNVRVNYLNVRVSDPPSLQAAFDIVGKLMAQVRYWRGAYHETISRLDRHTDDLAEMRRDRDRRAALEAVVEAVRQWGPHTPRRVTRALIDLDAVLADTDRGPA